MPRSTNTTRSITHVKCFDENGNVILEKKDFGFADVGKIKSVMFLINSPYKISEIVGNTFIVKVKPEHRDYLLGKIKTIFEK